MKDIVAIESTGKVFLEEEYNGIEFYEVDIKTGVEKYLGHCSGYFPKEVKDKILEIYKGE